MSELILKLIDLPFLTTGRRLYAQKCCLQIAATHSPQIVPLIESAIAHDKKTVALEQAWARSKNVTQTRGTAATLDNKIDAVIGAIHSILKSNMAVLEPADPINVAATKIVEQLFPNGSRAIISKPFEEQLVINDTLIQRLTTDLSDQAHTASIQSHVTRLKTLNQEFSEELQKLASKETNFDEVEAARDEGNLYIKRITAVVIGTHHQNNPETATLRQTLLAPILDQCDRIREARKGRRRPQDINPETGEETTELETELEETA